ncbi:MAG: SIMPL domain-containing protein [Chloroflexota bacterium]
MAAACSGGETQVITGDPAAGITVAGIGEVQAPPDTGFFSAGVEVTGPTVAEARNRAAAAADAVVSSLQKNGVDKKDIQTNNFSINPQYDFRNAANPQRIIGYTVTNNVEVKVRKLDDFSKLIDEAARAGGDDVRVAGIRFGIENTTRLLEQAREAAMKDARTKAEELAKLGGVRLGAPMSITEVAGNNPPPIFSERSAAGFQPDIATPIEPGAGKVTVNVSVRWAIES